MSLLGNDVCVNDYDDKNDDDDDHNYDDDNGDDEDLCNCVALAS